MKRLLITGAAGFVGRNLIESAKQSGGFEILPMDRYKSGLPNEIVLDLEDNTFASKLEGLPFVDAVVHLGARTGWDGSTKDELFRPNILATSALANWVKRRGAYFVFASAAIVCGVKTPYINSENEPNPDTDYGYSKLLAEEIIKMSGIRHAILRIAGIFGKNGPQHLGLNRAIADVLSGKPPVLYGSGKIKRNYIYVKDVAEIILYCIDKNIEETHLVAGSRSYTIAEMLQILCDVLLPGAHPECRDSKEGTDQVVEHSSALPRGRTFDNAIKDIRDSIK